MSPTPIVLPSGIELNFVRVGSGPTLIFIHGAMGDFRAWIPQWVTFIQRFDCISYSRRYSYPNSNELNDRSHSALVDAEDLEQLMDSLDIEKAILVGSSYGGFTALATALRIPERIRALVAVEAPMMRYAERNPETAEVVRAFREASADPARVAFEAGDDLTGVMTLTGGIAGQAPDSIPQHVLQRRMENARAARSLAISDDEFPWLEPDDLASLPMPVLLISGNDTAPIHAAIFSEVCKAMPKARVRIVEGSGHSVSQMQPEIFNSEVLEFLKDNNCLS
jgi:pimeloyl-ACP methyl ester carboxylesterase